MAIRDFRLGRLKFITVIDEISEDLGESVDVVGSAVVIGEPGTEKLSLSLPVRGDVTEGSTAGDRLRRQVRGMALNAALRAGAMYLRFDKDPDQNGWLILGGGEIKSGTKGLTFGDYRFEARDAYRVGRFATHRPSRRASITDLRSAAAPRDTLGRLFSTDFATQSVLSIVPLGISISDPVGTAGLPLTASTISTSDGTLGTVSGVVDGDTISFEQTETAIGLGTITAYDTRGSTLAAPSAGQDPEATSAWEELFGPAQPLTGPPVIQNGRCRLRWVVTGATVPCYALDVWSGTAWVEQARLVARRNAGALVNLDQVRGVRVVELTRNRVVVELIMGSTGDATARDRVLFTLQDGWTGPRVEIYASPRSGGAAANAQITVSFPPPANLVGLLRYESGSVRFASLDVTETTDTGALPAFSGENWAALLRPGSGAVLVLAVLQAAAALSSTRATLAYTTLTHLTTVAADAYASVHVGTTIDRDDQAFEIDASFSLGSSTTIISDPAATGGQAVSISAGSGASARIRSTPNGLTGRYRAFLRARTTPGGSANWTLTLTSGAATASASLTSSAFVWVDLGEITLTGAALDLTVARSTGSGAVVVDILELFKLEDRGSGGRLDGARDHGQSVLVDVRALPDLVTR